MRRVKGVTPWRTWLPGLCARDCFSSPRPPAPEGRRMGRRRRGGWPSASWLRGLRTLAGTGHPFSSSIVSFQLGIAAVNLNGKLGVIRQDGRYLIQPEYDTLLPIDCGLYIAQKGGGWGVVSILPFPDGAGEHHQCAL